MHCRVRATQSSNEMAFRLKETTNKVRSQMIAQIRQMEKDKASLRRQIIDIEEKAENKVPCHTKLSPLMLVFVS